MRNLINQKIRDAILSINTFFLNEKEYQLYIANYLKNCGAFDSVFMEYNVPLEYLENYPWNLSNVFIDIVVKKDNVYYPIEIKFKTKSQVVPYNLFGTEIQIALSNQSQYTVSKYEIWKDIKRLEILKENFRNVELGFLVFVTNDNTYLDRPKNEFNSSRNFSIEQSRNVMAGTILEWTDDVLSSINRPAFRLNYNYWIYYDAMRIEGHHYFISFVENY